VFIGVRLDSLIRTAIGARIGTGPRPGSDTPTLTSITVTPNASTFVPAASTDRQQMTATGHYSDTSTADITSSVTWDTDNHAIATVDSAGAVAAVAGGISGPTAATCNVSATLGAVSGSTTLTVDTDTDATSGWRLPRNAYQWSLLGETPSHLWRCTEASGNLADSIGSLTLTATSLLYAQAVTGFTKTGIGMDATTDKAIAASGSGPNPATTSSLCCWIVVVPAAAPGSVRDLIFPTDGATNMTVVHTTTDRLRIVINGVSATGTVDPGGARLIGSHYDRANSAANVYSDQEKVVGTYAAGLVDGNKGIGDGPNTAEAGTVYAYGWGYDGSAAERTTASVAALFGKIRKSAVSWS
jgi:hypothetical protein